MRQKPARTNRPQNSMLRGATTRTLNSSTGRALLLGLMAVSQRPSYRRRRRLKQRAHPTSESESARRSLNPYRHVSQSSQDLHQFRFWATPPPVLVDKRVRVGVSSTHPECIMGRRPTAGAKRAQRSPQFHFDRRHGYVTPNHYTHLLDH